LNLKAGAPVELERHCQKEFKNMKSVPLNATVRSLGRRNGSRQLRASGRIPAVIYGSNNQPQSLEINSREIRDLIHHSVSENILIDLSVKDDARPKRLALVQEIQHHPLNGSVLHVDFHEVSETEKVTIMVPVETSGEAVGVKIGGGVLEHVLFKIKVRALPKNLPEQVMVDVSSLELNKTIHLGEIQAPEGVEILGDKKIPVVSVAAPRTETEAVAAEATAATPGVVEMIKEKKEGEEGAAAKGGKGAAPAKAAAPAEKKK
jgi:large subunit ribosomal protein L25